MCDHNCHGIFLKYVLIVRWHCPVIIHHLRITLQRYFQVFLNLSACELVKSEEFCLAACMEVFISRGFERVTSHRMRAFQNHLFFTTSWKITGLISKITDSCEDIHD